MSIMWPRHIVCTHHVATVASERCQSLYLLCERGVYADPRAVCQCSWFWPASLISSHAGCLFGAAVSEITVILLLLLLLLFIIMYSARCGPQSRRRIVRARLLPGHSCSWIHHCWHGNPVAAAATTTLITYDHIRPTVIDDVPVSTQPGNKSALS